MVRKIGWVLQCQLRSNTRRHMRMHMGEKSYSCSICSKRFHQHSDWGHHVHIHTGEKALSGSVCNTSFTQLVQHMGTHTGWNLFLAPFVAKALNICSFRAVKFDYETFMYEFLKNQDHMTWHHVTLEYSNTVIAEVILRVYVISNTLFCWFWIMWMYNRSQYENLAQIQHSATWHCPSLMWTHLPSTFTFSVVKTNLRTYN